MIDCLSNPDWINPQINFLLFWQNIRIGSTEIIDKFFLSITVFGEFWLPTIICAITYWCIDFKAGIYLFSLEGLNIFLTHLFKMLACVHRPWILSNKIHPSELAVPFAKGYSFPSGHSAMSSSVLGGAAYLLRKKKILCTLLVCFVLMIGFSRLWLGVHTPQDVLCGLILGFSLVFIVKRIIEWAEKDISRYWRLMLCINILAVVALVYIYFFNSYRLDYVSGKLIVDPAHLKSFTAIVYGYALGAIDGSFLCRMYFPFNPKETPVKQRIARGIIGAAAIIIIFKTVMEQVLTNKIPTLTAAVCLFLLGIFITLIYPIIFTKIKKI